MNVAIASRGSHNRGWSPSALSGLRLSKEAERLLSGLSEAGAAAVPDPIQAGMLVLRVRRANVSLGRGSYRVEAARELAGFGLVEADGQAGTFAISEPGQARQRRAAAPDGLAFQAQHLELAIAAVPGEEEGPRSVLVNAAESPLEWLRRRKDRDGRPMIDAASYEAGERLRRDLTVGGILPSVTARWEGRIGGGAGAVRDPAGATDAMVAARQRTRAALEAVGGEFADLLVDLCGFLKGLELIERERGWPLRSGKVVVGLALRRLAGHYGLAAEARGPERSRGLRAWHGPEAAAGSD